VKAGASASMKERGRKRVKRSVLFSGGFPLSCGKSRVRVRGMKREGGRHKKRGKNSASYYESQAAGWTREKKRQQGRGLRRCGGNLWGKFVTLRKREKEQYDSRNKRRKKTRVWPGVPREKERTTVQRELDLKKKKAICVMQGEKGGSARWDGRGTT